MIGDRLRQFRNARGDRLIVFAKLLEIPHNTLSDIENNKSKPSAQTLITLRRKTDINIDWLLTGEGTMERTTWGGTDPNEDLLDKIQSSGIARELFVRDMVSDYAGSDKDQSLLWIILYLKQAWEKADPEERTWIKVQFRKAFPDFDESTIMNSLGNNERGGQTDEEGTE